MRFTKKLNLWKENGLISQEQVDAINVFENNFRKDWIPKAFLSLGVLSLSLGLISVVAANWRNFPDMSKIIGHLLITIALGWETVRKDNQAKHNNDKKSENIKDVFLVLFTISILTFVALTGQILQMQSELYRPLTFWFAITTPAVWYFGKSKHIARFWVLSFIAVMFSAFDIIKPFIENVLDPLRITLGVLWGIAVLLYSMPLLSTITSKRWHYAASLNKIGQTFIFIITIMASLAPFKIDLANINDKYYFRENALPSALIIGIISVLYWIKVSTLKQKDVSKFFVALSGVVTALPFAIAFHHPEIIADLVSVLFFIVFWLAVAIIASIEQNKPLFKLASILIGIRLITVYLEVFGTLTITGLGLIITGVVMFFVAKIWKKTEQKFYTLIIERYGEK